MSDAKNEVSWENVTDEDKKKRKAEAYELLKFFLENHYKMPEEESNELYQKITVLSPDPYIMDYVFWPKGPEMTAEEIIEKAWSYQAITL